MIGLRKVSNTTFVETMQQINASLPNVRFAIPSIAPVPLAGLSVWLCFANDHSPSGWWSVGTLALSIATFAIAAAGNVPLNNALDAAGRTDDAAAREAFELPWIRLNDLRTYTSIAAFASSVGALVNVL